MLNVVIGHGVGVEQIVMDCNLRLADGPIRASFGHVGVAMHDGRIIHDENFMRLAAIIYHE